MPRDDLGRVLNLESVPRRIVVIGPGATEMVFALGAGERLVGRDSASDYPPNAFPKGVKGVAVVGDYTGPFLESTIAARPDFIIVQGETYGRARIEEWQKKCAVPVASLAATTVEGVARDIEKVGAWLGVAERAQSLASNLRTEYKSIPGSNGKAFFEVGRKPLWTAGKETLIDDILNRALFVNVARNVTSYKQYNLESLLSNQPDSYIVTTGRVNSQLKPDQMHFAEGSPALFAREYRRVLSELRRDRVLKNLRCIQQGHVVVVPSDWVLRPGPRLAKGINELKNQHGKWD